MADSIPSLRRKLNEAMSRIRELEAREPEVVIERVVERLEVPGPERVVENPVPFEVEVVKWREKTIEVDRPVEVVKEVIKPVIEYVDRIIEKHVPFEVEVIKWRDRIVEVPVTVEVIKEVPVEIVKYVDREIEKPVILEKEVIKWRDVVKEVTSPPEVITRVIEVPVETVREVYFPIPGPETIIHQDNPDHLATIRVLQEKLCQFTSQSDSLSSQDQEPEQSQSAPE